MPMAPDDMSNAAVRKRAAVSADAKTGVEAAAEKAEQKTLKKLVTKKR